MSVDPRRSNRIGIAAHWLSRQSIKPSPIIPHLRHQFGLSPVEAVEAIRLADVHRLGAVGMRGRIDFDAVNVAAVRALPALLDRWLPNGRRQGREWVALNPTRGDRRPGSFRINMATGRWSDFATGDAGGDPISLAAYLHGLSQLDAARRVGEMLGVPELSR